MKKIELTLKETVDLMDNVLSQLNNIDTDQIDLVVAIENGGVHFGKYIASKLNKPLETIKIQFYGDGDQASQLPLKVDINIDKLRGKKILLVDDIVDSGRTIAYFKNTTGLSQPEDFVLVSLHWCKGSVVSPNYFGTYKDRNDWIIYPWERQIGFDEWWNVFCKNDLTFLVCDV